MSSLSHAIAILDDVAFACRGHGALLVRVFGALLVPAACILLSLALLGDPGRPQGDLIALVESSDFDALWPLLGGAVPPLILLLLTAIALTCAGALLGWQLLHGRAATPRALFLTLYRRRWGILGLCLIEAVAYGGAGLLFMGAALPLYAALPGGLTSALLTYAWPLLLYGAALPLSFFFFLAPSALMIEGLGAVGALRRGVGLLGVDLALVVWGWGAAQALGVGILLNLRGLLLGQSLLEGGGFIPTLGSLGPRALGVALGLGLLALPIKGLLQVGVYRALVEEKDADFLSSSAKALKGEVA